MGAGKVKRSNSDCWGLMQSIPMGARIPSERAKGLLIDNQRTIIKNMSNDRKKLEQSKRSRIDFKEIIKVLLSDVRFVE